MREEESTRSKVKEEESTEKVKDVVYKNQVFKEKEETTEKEKDVVHQDEM